MRFSRRSICCLSIALTAACGRGEPVANAAAGPDGGTLVIAEPGDADNLLPPLASTIVGRAVSDLVFDHLAEIDDSLHTIGDAGFTPRLADRWTWTKDSLSITFHLNPRARWHDGQPVRAVDVRFSLALAKNPELASPFTPLLANVDSATVRDSLTAVMWLHRRMPESFYDIAYQLWILPEHVYGSTPPNKLATAEVSRHPVGSGRFRFESWEPGSRLVLVSDTGNYRGRAKLDRIIWSITPDNNAAYAQIASGQADLLENATPDQIKSATSVTAIRPFPYPALQYAFLGMNFRDPAHQAQPHPILSDIRVRRAISMAIDRRAMLRNVFDSLGNIGYGPFPRAVNTADTTLRLPPFDVAHAQSLLDSAGWSTGPDGMRRKNGRPLLLRVIVPTSSASRMQYAVLVQAALRTIGITLNIDAGQFPAFYAKQQAGDFDLVLAAYSSDPSASGMTQFWAASAAAPIGGNVLSYANPRFEALLDSALSSFSALTAKNYAVRSYQVLADDVPAVWLYDVLSFGLINKRFHVTTLRADGYWEHLADWTVPPAERIDRDRIGIGAPKP